LTIGWDERGKPVLRESTYLDGPPSGLRVVSIDGQAQPVDCGAPQRLRQRDSVRPDWPTAAEAVWSELARLVPQEPRYAIEVHDLRLEELDEALATAIAISPISTRTSTCVYPTKPSTDLRWTKGGRGQLIARHPKRGRCGSSRRQHDPRRVGDAARQRQRDEGWVRASRTPVTAPSGGRFGACMQPQVGAGSAVAIAAMASVVAPIARTKNVRTRTGAKGSAGKATGVNRASASRPSRTDPPQEVNSFIPCSRKNSARVSAGREGCRAARKSSCPTRARARHGASRTCARP
jgi:hypothetical protein